MKKLIYLLIFIGLIVGVGAGTIAAGMFKKPTNDTTNVLSVQTQPENTQQGETQASTSLERSAPVRVVIPKIGVDTEVEHVGNDEKGNMDVPVDYANTAWYEPGFKPGQKGNAVLAGHLDNKDGSPAVFWDIKKLEPGDEIKITDEKGNELTFAVTEKAEYPNQGFPIQQVFGASTDAMLNLITCHGTYSSGSGYDQRYVVYSKLVE